MLQVIFEIILSLFARYADDVFAVVFGRKNSRGRTGNCAQKRTLCVGGQSYFQF